LRKLILAAGLLAAAAPLAAQPARRPVPLPPPGAVGQMGDRVSDVADALMDVDVGPVVDAIDPGRPHRERTLGDFASRRDPYARERMHDSIARTSARVNATAREIAIMTPMLLRSFEDARRRLAAAMNAPIPRRDYRDDAPDYRPDYRDDPYYDEEP
jgi:hypothetical protein